MHIVGQLIKQATDESVSLTVLLRNAMVLAYDLENDKLKTWVQLELDGYPDNSDAIPPYRKLPAHSTGNFLGYCHSQLRNAPIPTINLPDLLKEYATNITLPGGIHSLEAILSSDTGPVRFPWPADVLAAYGSEMYENYTCADASRLVSRSQVAQILDTVRNRLRTFLLEIEQISPDIKNGDDVAAISPETVAQLFNVTIMGDSNVLAMGQTVEQHANQSIQQGDAAALREGLRNLGVPDNEIDQLEEAIEKDGTPSNAQGLGTHVRIWLGKATEKIASGAWEVGSNLAISTLPKLILSYFGLDGTQ